MKDLCNFSKHAVKDCKVFLLRNYYLNSKIVEETSVIEHVGRERDLLQVTLQVIPLISARIIKDHLFVFKDC